MPSRRAPSATGRRVILRTPFKERDDGRQHTHRFPGTPVLPGNFLEVWEMSALEQSRGDEVSQLGLASLQTTFDVVIARSALVATTPPRPGEHLVCGRRREPDEPCKKMAHFWGGQGKHGRSSGKFRRSRRRRGETFCRANACKVSKSQEYKRNVSVPTDEAPHFVVVHAEIFAVFKIFLNMPSGANSLNHFWQRGSLRGKDKVVRFLGRISKAATNEQPMSSIILPLMEHGDDGPIEEPRAFGA